MIRNEREYKITKAAADKFRAALKDEASPPPKGVHPRLHKASFDGMRAQLEDLDDQLQSYESLRAGKLRGRIKGTIHELGDVLVRARIARKWTQRQLADRLGIHMQQVQKYEADSYASASVTRICDVLTALGADVDIEVKLVELPELVAAGSAAKKR